MSIFDLLTSAEIVAYWDDMQREAEPYMGEELFPDEKSIGMTIEWIKGASGIPVVLKPSALDVEAIPRPRIGYESLKAQMPFFKESKYVDENLRQELNKVLATGNQQYIDLIMERIFDDEMDLLKGAAAQRERMRMMALTTGTVALSANGQALDYDYGMPDDHTVTVTKSWSDPTATIMADLRAGIEKIIADTGATPTRAICSTKVFGYFRINTEIKSVILASSDGVGYLSDNKIKQYIVDELGLEIRTNDKRYVDEAGATQRYVADDVFVMFPSGALGSTVFGTTPEESDLLSSGVANVTITDTGVAVTTMTKADPVNVETKVTQICLPSFPLADQVYILDVIAA